MQLTDMSREELIALCEKIENALVERTEELSIMNDFKDRAEAENAALKNHLQHMLEEFVGIDYKSFGHAEASKYMSYTYGINIYPEGHSHYMRLVTHEWLSKQQKKIDTLQARVKELETPNEYQHGPYYERSSTSDVKGYFMGCDELQVVEFQAMRHLKYVFAFAKGGTIYEFPTREEAEAALEKLKSEKQP